MKKSIIVISLCFFVSWNFNKKTFSELVFSSEFDKIVYNFFNKKPLWFGGYPQLIKSNEPRSYFSYEYNDKQFDYPVNAISLKNYDDDFERYQYFTVIKYRNINIYQLWGSSKFYPCSAQFLRTCVFTKRYSIFIILTIPTNEINCNDGLNKNELFLKPNPKEESRKFMKELIDFFEDNLK